MKTISLRHENAPGTTTHLRQRYDRGEELTAPELNELAYTYGHWVWDLVNEERELAKNPTLDPDYYPVEPDDRYDIDLELYQEHYPDGDRDDYLEY